MHRRTPSSDHITGRSEVTEDGDVQVDVLGIEQEHQLADVDGLSALVPCGPLAAVPLRSVLHLADSALAATGGMKKAQEMDRRKSPITASPRSKAAPAPSKPAKLPQRYECRADSDSEESEDASERSESEAEEEDGEEDEDYSEEESSDAAAKAATKKALQRKEEEEKRLKAAAEAKKREAKLVEERKQAKKKEAAEAAKARKEEKPKSVQKPKEKPPVKSKPEEKRKKGDEKEELKSEKEKKQKEEDNRKAKELEEKKKQEKKKKEEERKRKEEEEKKRKEEEKKKKEEEKQKKEEEKKRKEKEEEKRKQREEEKRKQREEEKRREKEREEAKKREKEREEERQREKAREEEKRREKEREEERRKEKEREEERRKEKEREEKRREKERAERKEKEREEERRKEREREEDRKREKEREDARKREKEREEERKRERDRDDRRRDKDRDDDRRREDERRRDREREKERERPRAVLHPKATLLLRDGGNPPANLLCKGNARVNFTLPCAGNERRSGKNLVSGHGVASDLETSPGVETDRETSPVGESDQETNLEGQETDLGVETSLGVESDQETSLGVESDPEKSLEVEIDLDLVKDVIGMTLGRVYQDYFKQDRERGTVAKENGSRRDREAPAPPRQDPPPLPEERFQAARLEECFQSLDLHHGQPLMGAPAALLAASGLSGVSTGRSLASAALCWEPSPAELQQLRRRLAPGGRLVVAGRPWRYQDWPMPKGKLGLVKDEMEICRDLREAGFDLTALRVATYHCEISLQKWLSLVSDLCSQAELQSFREEMLTQFQADGASDGTEQYLHFEDRLLLLIARLPTDWGCCAKRLRLSKVPMPWPMRLALDGFWAPLVPLTPQQAAEALAQVDRHAQLVRRSDTARAEELVGEERFKLHLLYPWAAELVCNPVILEAVRQALGTANVLVWFSEVNAKGPRSPCHAAPHQDGIFASLAPNDAVITVWLALTDALAEMGGLYFHRGSHLQGALPHHVDPEAENLIGFRADHEGEGTEGEAVPVELKAGEASLHSFRTLHWSGPNLTALRRVGLAVRYVRADVQRSRRLRRRESAMLACGRYDAAEGAFDVEDAPTHPFGSAEVAQHADALARERENYWADEAACTMIIFGQFPPPLPTSSQAEAAGPGKTDHSSLTFAGRRSPVKTEPPKSKVAPIPQRDGDSSSDYSEESSVKPRSKRKRRHGSEVEEKPGQRENRLAQHTRVRASCMQEE
eukprot:s855_g19.t1